MVHDSQRDGHVSLPNGLGVDHTDDGGETVAAGVAPNELTSASERDPWVGHAAPQARPGAPGTARVGRIDQDAGMTRDEWIAEFAAELGVDPPDAETVETLLDLAGTAAHASERTAAPIACYLVGLAGAAVAPDISPDRAARIAESIGPPAS